MSSDFWSLRFRSQSDALRVTCEYIIGTVMISVSNQLADRVILRNQNWPKASFENSQKFWINSCAKERKEIYTLKHISENRDRKASSFKVE